MEFRKHLSLAAVFTAIILVVAVSVGAVTEKIVYQKDPQSCAKCHLIKQYVDTWSQSDFLDHAHSKKGIGCRECHQLSPQQEKANVNAFNKNKFKTPLKVREYDQEMCLRCHGSYKEIIERTRDLKAKGLSRNPHDSHYKEVQCNLCHRAHRESVDYCSQCHPPVVKKPGWKTM
jgi:hypothetical protein